MTTTLQAPFPWFGGKSRVADIVWRAVGNVPNWVDPFFGSGAVELARPHPPGIETVNDKDGYLSNFWRAVAAEPQAVSYFAQWPVNENDLHARHVWLVQQKEALASRLEGDYTYYDAQIAGFWVWGICAWIGGGFCSGKGPWRSVDGQLTQADSMGSGIRRQLPYLSGAGHGVHRKRPHLMHEGQGVLAKRGVSSIEAWMQALQDRLWRTRVVCGDWRRVCGPSVTIHNGLTGVLLDPPYDLSERDAGLYSEDTAGVAKDVAAWAMEWGDHPLMRIVMCGYEGEHDFPGTWRRISWKTQGGYGRLGNGRGRDNAGLERIWFSPHCLDIEGGAQLDFGWDAMP